MRKTITFITIVSCLLLLLTGCMGQAKPKDAGSMHYKISKQSHINKEVMINYPEVTGMSDSEKQKKINGLIKQEAFSIVNRYSKEGLDKLSLKLNCEIKLEKPGILSIAYSGYHFSDSIFFTTNIDMRNGSRIRIQDLVNINDDLAEKLQSGNYFSTSPNLLQERKKPANEEWVKELGTADLPGFPQEAHGMYTYLTSSSLGVSFEVQVPYENQDKFDKVHVEVPYQDIASNLKTENTIWEEIYGQAHGSADYKLVNRTYADRNIRINYPEIVGMNDKSRQEKINELIKKEALDQLNYYSEEQLDQLSLELNCEIKVQRPELLSIAYAGFRHLQGSVYFPFFTTNIDMRDGSRLRIQDLVNISPSFAEKIQNGRYFPQSVRIPLQRVKEIISENAFQGLHTADYSEGMQNQYGIYTYFTSGSLGVSVGLPRPYGHHIEIEIPYQDITNNIKTENTVWINFIRNGEQTE